MDCGPGKGRVRSVLMLLSLGTAWKWAVVHGCRETCEGPRNHGSRGYRASYRAALS